MWAFTWWAAVVPRRFDQQPAGVPSSGLGDVPLAAGLAGAVPRGHPPEVTHQLTGPLKRAKSPISTASPMAESVSIPRRHRSRATA
jgi:hypothetical protein